MNTMKPTLRKWIVDCLKETKLQLGIDNSKSDRITITRQCMLPGKVRRFVSLDLLLIENQLEIQPLCYEFHARNSHFDYVMPESRYTRNQGMILLMVNLLRRTNVWKFVANKTFFQVNESNKQLSGKTLAEVEKKYHDAFHGKIVKEKLPPEAKD